MFDLDLLKSDEDMDLIIFDIIKPNTGEVCGFVSIESVRNAWNCLNDRICLEEAERGRPYEFKFTLRPQKRRAVKIQRQKPIMDTNSGLVKIQEYAKEFI